MFPMVYRLGAALVLPLLAGCESNPEGPRVPPHSSSNASTEARPAPEKPGRQPAAKRKIEIVIPD
jgi:hypothetical protein